MREYKCSDAVKDDLASVYRIELDVFGEDAWDPLAIAFFLYLDLAVFTVCRANGEVAGYAIGVMEKDGAGHLLNIAVARSYQGRGIGKALLSDMEKKLRDRGARRIYLEVRKDNFRAIEFYRSQGYTVSGVKKGYYLDGMDAIVMEKKILVPGYVDG